VKRRKTVLGGGKKRKRHWKMHTKGQAYDQQQDRLKTIVSNLFHGDVSHEYVM
jgi:hypothetical protein